MAVSVAAELSSINYRETAITLTPSDSGRFEVYLDGKKLYDRKEPGAVDFLPALKRSYQIAANEKISTVINCQAKREFWQKAQCPPGFLGKVEPGCMAYDH